MGLDMEIVRITRSHKDSGVIYDRRELDGVILSKEELEEAMYRQLAPYMQPVKVKTQYVNLKKIQKDYGLSDEPYISSASGSVTGFTDGKRTIRIPNSDILSKYITDRTEDLFVCDRDRVKYWRKEYEIQDWFHDNIGYEMENTGFYLLTGELLTSFNRAFPAERVWPDDPTEESALFYWEWY